MISSEKIVDSTVKKRIDDLEEMTDLQCSNGNWNFDPYMHGMANGMIYSLDLVKGDNDPKFKDAPERWLDDKVNKTAKEILLECEF